MKAICLPLLLGLLATSCSSVPRAKTEDDAQAKKFETRADSCGLYVFRSESDYPATDLDLDLDGYDFGPTAPKTFRFEWLSPGKHTLTSEGEHDAELEIDAKAGTLFYVWQEVKFSDWRVSSVFHVVDAAKGQAGVKRCELLEAER